MFNFTLFKREMRGSLKTLLIFAAVLTMYIIIIITMFEPEMVTMLQQFSETMPEVMAAVGMMGASTDLTGFISSYTYGFILPIFPMVFIILSANGLVARYVDKGSMVSLVSAPVKRTAIAFTQMNVLVSGIIILLSYVTVLEIVCSELYFPGALDIQGILLINLGLLSLHFFIGGICFFASCMFSDAKYSIGFGAGIPSFMFILQMLANTGGSAENIKYITFFTLFNPDGILAGETGAMLGIAALFAGAVLLFSGAVYIFSKKDLHI